MYKHYIRTNREGEVLLGFTNAYPETVQENDILLHETPSAAFQLHMDGELNPGILDKSGVPLFLYKDGKVVEREKEDVAAAIEALPRPEPGPEAKLATMLEAVQIMSATLPDAQVQRLGDMYNVWKAGTDYEMGTIVRHDGTLYRVVQAHTAQTHQPPGSEGMLAIYRPVQAEPEQGEVLPWVYGETVAQGDRRVYQGVVYECIGAGGAGANVWTPDTAPAVWKIVG